MSNCPYLLKGARTGFRLGDHQAIDSMIADTLSDVYENFHMGMTGELVCRRILNFAAEGGMNLPLKAIAKRCARSNRAS